MKNTLERQENGNIVITITVPWKTVSDYYNRIVDGIVAKAEVKGFRKGKAPRSVVEKKLDKSTVYEDVIREMVPSLYDQAVKEQNLRPIVIPKIELIQASEQKDWVIRATTAERPEIELDGYKENISAANKDKHKKIWVPGQEQKPAEKEADKPSLDAIVKALLESVKIRIPQIILENEVNRMLSELIDQTKKLGLTVEQYLASTGKTSQSLKYQYTEEARRSITLEFALEKIADVEGVLVSDDDLDKVISSAKNPAEKQSLEKQRYYIASVLRRQKTLDFLAGL